MGGAEQQGVLSPASTLPPMQGSQLSTSTEPQPVHVPRSRRPASPAAAASPRSASPAPPAYLGALANWLTEEQELDSTTARKLVGEWDKANKPIIKCQQYTKQMMVADTWLSIPSQLRLSFTKFVQQKGVSMGSYGDSDEPEDTDPMPQQQPNSEVHMQGITTRDTVMAEAAQTLTRQHRLRKAPGAWWEGAGQGGKDTPSTRQPGAQQGEPMQE